MNEQATTTATKEPTSFYARQALATKCSDHLIEAIACLKQLGYMTGDSCFDDLVSVDERLHVEFRRMEIA